MLAPLPKGLTLPNVTDDERRTLDVAALHAQHAQFVWRSLYFMGIPRADLPDLSQEVFLTLVRKQHEYDPSRPLRAWLWGICLGLVQNYRRRHFRRLEVPLEQAEDRASDASPESALDAARARRRALETLASMDPEKRAVFVMFEVEHLSGKEIARELEVPVGTVHSRLHAARRSLTAALEGRSDETESEETR